MCKIIFVSYQAAKQGDKIFKIDKLIPGNERKHKIFNLLLHKLTADIQAKGM